MICQGAEAHDKDMLLGEHFVDLLDFGRPRLAIKHTWHMAYEPRRFICVVCVHPLPASALRFLLGLRRHEAGNARRDRM
jgi:hypothetical protein